MVTCTSDEDEGCHDDSQLHLKQLKTLTLEVILRLTSVEHALRLLKDVLNKS